METKICNKCNIKKPQFQFRKRKDTKTGYGSTCKECENIVNKLYRERTKNKAKNYRNINKEKLKKYFKKRYEENKENISSYFKNRYPRIKEKKKEYDKKYLKKNKIKIKKYRQEYYQKNKKTIIEKSINYKEKRKKTDLLFRLKIAIKNNISLAIKRNGLTKKSKTLVILGCSYQEFKQHLESQFESWMKWENYGLYNGEVDYGWDIDHIIPISSAKTEDELIRLNHYTNLQPLCSYQNRVIKRDRK